MDALLSKPLTIHAKPYPIILPPPVAAKANLLQFGLEEIFEAFSKDSVNALLEFVRVNSDDDALRILCDHVVARSVLKVSELVMHIFMGVAQFQLSEEAAKSTLLRSEQAMVPIASLQRSAPVRPPGPDQEFLHWAHAS